MSQCVPSWDIEDDSAPSKIKYYCNSPQDVPSLDYEVAELTWENGQIAMHGLGVPRVANKHWEKPRAGGTLESIVNQATFHHQLPLTPKSAAEEADAPWFEHHERAAAVEDSRRSASVTVTMDALVPCNNSRRHERGEAPAVGGGCSTRVGSCSGGQAMTVDTWEREMSGAGLTSMSLISPGNTVSDHDYAKTSAHDPDYSISLGSRSLASDHRNGNDDEVRRRENGKSSIGTKRSRAAIHNQSERKRRDKINQRMKTLQKLVPNSSKSDKASMLDEVIEYLKQLQAQVNMMSTMNMPTMMLPLAMQQQLLSMMGMGMGMGCMNMGMGMGVMDINTMNRPSTATVVPRPTAPSMPVATAPWNKGGDSLPPPPPPPASVMPDPLTLLGCQTQPMTMEAYSRMQAAMLQQLQQQAGFKN